MVFSRRGTSDKALASYVQVSVPMRLPDAGRLIRSNLPQAGLWPTSCWQTTDSQSSVGFPEVSFLGDIQLDSCGGLSREPRASFRIARARSATGKVALRAWTPAIQARLPRLVRPEAVELPPRNVSRARPASSQAERPCIRSAQAQSGGSARVDSF